eukprot:gnl/MRDRNA2_/MRDRNA2_27956_c0_seq1.p1 gnl/MRDRNA2_/MRDRNA2_27956_c0~~gnl/MRDRNA2_/MRDRNA2_27956_c0_seq1.p1  ORF type:complete len:502 (+),score=88.71 gnl/MRDRNA2_/MRDRNA2_27956_c0_seq1:129-1634(+)
MHLLASVALVLLPVKGKDITSFQFAKHGKPYRARLAKSRHQIGTLYEHAMENEKRHALEEEMEQARSVMRMQTAGLSEEEKLQPPNARVEVWKGNTWRDNDQLPHGWEFTKGKKTIHQGEMYYRNQDTGEASWSRPVQLPLGWGQYIDPSSGKQYFCNRATGESSWTQPTSEPSATVAAVSVAEGATTKLKPVESSGGGVFGPTFPEARASIQPDAVESHSPQQTQSAHTESTSFDSLSLQDKKLAQPQPNSFESDGSQNTQPNAESSDADSFLSQLPPPKNRKLENVKRKPVSLTGESDDDDAFNAIKAETAAVYSNPFSSQPSEGGTLLERLAAIRKQAGLDEPAASPFKPKFKTGYSRSPFDTEEKKDDTPRKPPPSKLFSRLPAAGAQKGPSSVYEMLRKQNPDLNPMNMRDVQPNPLESDTENFEITQPKKKIAMPMLSALQSRSKCTHFVFSGVAVLFVLLFVVITVSKNSGIAAQSVGTEHLLSIGMSSSIQAN